MKIKKKQKYPKQCVSTHLTKKQKFLAKTITQLKKVMEKNAEELKKEKKSANNENLLL